MTATIIRFPLPGQASVADDELIPSPKQLDVAPIMEEWFRKRSSEGHYQLFDWVDGSSTMTSTVMAIDLDDGWVRLVGLWCRLGRVCGAA